MKIDEKITMEQFTDKVSATVKKNKPVFKNKKIEIWEIDGAKGTENDSDVPVANILSGTNSGKVIPVVIQTK